MSSSEYLVFNTFSLQLHLLQATRGGQTTALLYGKAIPEFHTLLYTSQTAVVTNKRFLVRCTLPTMEPTVSRINTRATNDEEIAARQLMQVFKDHSNTMVTEMVRTSNTYCYAQARRSVSDGEGSSSQAVDEPTYFPASPCQLVVVDRNQFVDTLVTVHANLVSDGLVCEFVERPNHTPSSLPTCPSDLTTTLTHIDDLMSICKHALYRGCSHDVRQIDGRRELLTQAADERRSPGACTKAFGFSKKDYESPSMCYHRAAELRQRHDRSECRLGVQSINKNIRSSSYRAGTFQKGVAEDVRPIVPYDCADEPDGGYFRSGILNSFHDRATQLNFLNKFYQCLVASRIPLKVRKVVVAGPKDSGKTSWVSILRRIIASITNEAQFSAAMINDETQLVLVDDWSASTMDSTLAKTLLQGGWMVASIKHKSPRCVDNNSPFYITTNNVPDFGYENENVRRRLAIFETKSSPETIIDADKWMYDNAMACNSWMAQELNEGIDMVEREERWYEHNVLAVTTASTTPNLDEVTLEEITYKPPSEYFNPLPRIHANFKLEAEDRLRDNLESETLEDEQEPIIRSDIDPPIPCSTLVIKRKRKRQ